jgi:hypothetical protein
MQPASIGGLFLIDFPLFADAPDSSAKSSVGFVGGHKLGIPDSAASCPQ